MTKNKYFVKFEYILGNTIAGILIVLWVFAILIGILNIVFWDEKSISPYGGRGAFYVAD